MYITDILHDWAIIMRISEKIEKFGYFWLPSTPDMKVPGILKVKDGGQVELEIFEFIEIIHKIVNLIGFAIDKVVALDYFEGCSDSIAQDLGNENKRSIPVKIFFSSIPFVNNKPKIDISNMLFQFRSIQTNSQEIIGKWMEAYTLIRPALDLYFSTISGGHSYLESNNRNLSFKLTGNS